MTRESFKLHKFKEAVYQDFHRSGWLLLICYFGNIAGYTGSDRGYWVFWGFMFGSYGLYSVIRKYRHPEPVDKRELPSRSRYFKVLLVILVIYTLGPWLFFKGARWHTEWPLLLLFWIVSISVCL